MVLENCSFQYCLLTDVSIAYSDVNIDVLFTLSKQHGHQQHTRLRECEC